MIQATLLESKKIGKNILFKTISSKNKNTNISMCYSHLKAYASRTSLRITLFETSEAMYLFPLHVEADFFMFSVCKTEDLSPWKMLSLDSKTVIQYR